jgi:hypothetical protein
MAKNSQTDYFLKDENDMVRELHQRYPLLKLKFDHSEYYCFVVFVMASQQLKHVISHSHKTHPALKHKALTHICEARQISCIHLTDLKGLQSLR